jgi:hypothetical protein
LKCQPLGTRNYNDCEQEDRAQRQGKALKGMALVYAARKQQNQEAEHRSEDSKDFQENR